MTRKDTLFAFKLPLLCGELSILSAVVSKLNACVDGDMNCINYAWVKIYRIIPEFRI